TALKREVRDRFRGDDRVFEYAGIWVPDAENPEDGILRGRLTGLEGLGERVEQDLRRGIARHFAEHLSALDPAPDPLADERDLHAAFVESRTRVHAARADIEGALTAYARGGSNRPLVLSGPPGSGKSASLAHWVARYADGGTSVARHDGITWVLAR